MATRYPQPRCDECQHARSFHSGGEACRALGCRCRAWEGVPIGAPDWLPEGLTVAEMAKAIGKGQTYVKEHAEELGGVKVPGAWLRPRQAGDVWRFSPEAAELQSA